MGPCQARARLFGVDDLKNVIKPFQVHFDDLKKAAYMASPGRKKVKKQER